MQKITIAIPVYNGMPYLRDAIQSVVNQTYKEWVLCLINDGSTDGSLEVMCEFSRNDSRIIVVDDGFNKGLIARLNQSVAITETKYYARMDADDIMHVNRIEEQVNYLESHPDVDVLGSSIMTIDSNNNIVGSGFSYGKVERFVHPTVMGKTTWFKANPYRDWATRAEDFELWTRTNNHSVFFSLDKPLLFYREFGVPTVKKTLMTLKTILRISGKYKEYERTFFWFFKVSSVTLFKMFVYSVLGLIGKENVIVKLRRRTEVPAKDHLTQVDLQNSIKRTEI